MNLSPQRPLQVNYAHRVDNVASLTAYIETNKRLARELVEANDTIRKLRQQLRSKYCGCAWCCATTPPENRGEAHSICSAP